MILTSAALGGVVGFASADDEGLSSFRTAQPHTGDRWQYESSIQIGDNEVAFASLHEWGDVAPVKDASGYEVEAAPLRSVTTTSEGTLREIHHVAGDAVVRQDIHLDDDLRFSASLVPFLPGVGPQRQASGTLAADVWVYDADVPCGAVHPFQSPEPVSLSAAVPMWGDCRVDEVEYVGLVNVGPAVLLRFEGQQDGTHLAIHFVPHLPIPVLIERTTDSYVWTTELTGFERGDAPWSTIAPPQRTTAIATTPATPWGPDDSGVQHPFPLSEAYRMITSDGDAAAEIGGATLVAVEGVPFQDERGEHFVWNMQWMQGDRPIAYGASRSTWDTSTNEGLVASLTQPRDQVFSTGALPDTDADCVPERFAALRPAMARYATLAGQPVSAIGWAALELQGDCDFIYMVGRAEVTLEDDGAFGLVDGSSFQADGQALTIDEGAEPRLLVTYTLEAREEPIGIPSKMAEPTPADESTIAPLTHDASLWETPSAETVVALGLLGILFGGAYWWWPAVKTLPVLSMFSRIRKDDLLDHPVRQALMDQVEGSPGIHYQALVKELGKGRGVVEHHLRKLETGGLIAAKRTGGYTCYYAKGRLDNAVMEAMPVIKSGTAAGILRAIVERPGVTAKELAASLGIAPSTASHHIARLRQVGLIDGATGRNVQLLPTGLADPALRARMT